MPTYVYRCDKCPNPFEAIQSIRTESEATCPTCKTVSTTRLITTVAPIRLKGSGFYETDYRKKTVQADGTSSVYLDASDGEIKPMNELAQEHPEIGHSIRHTEPAKK